MNDKRYIILDLNRNRIVWEGTKKECKKYLKLTGKKGYKVIKI